MGKYVLRRIVYWIPALLLLALSVYAMAFFGAGDPIKLMFLREEGDVTYDAQRLDAIRKEKGLDRPFLVQFGEYTWHLVQGDLGMSVISGRSVNDMIGATAPVSFQIGLATVILVAILGIPLGIIAGLNHNKWADNTILGTALFISGVPSYVVGPMLMVFLVLVLGVMKTTPYGWDGLFSKKAILPLFVMVFGSIAIIIRQTRSGVLEVLSEDYVRTARAKGVPEMMVIIRHMLRPVLTPVVTVMGQMLIGIVNGAIIVEKIFGIPGLGRLTIDFTYGVDYPVIVAITLIGAFLVMALNLLVDLTYPILDPRAAQAMTGAED